MSVAQIAIAFFLFVMAFTGAALLLFQWRLRVTPVSAGQAGLATEEEDRELWPTLIRSMRFLGEVAAQGKQPESIRGLLTAAGFPSPEASTVFHGIRIAAVVLAVLGAGWIGLFVRESLGPAFVLAGCAGAFSFLAPAKVLRRMGKARSLRLDRALPSALDLMVLSLESGQSLDSALVEAGRELRNVYPDLAMEFQQAWLELKAGRSRSDVLASLGVRSDSLEMRKFAAVMIDSDRFGTGLAPALRTHAKYLRVRRRQSAQEEARKLTTKMIFPIFFLIMPAVFVVTLGPAILQFKEAIGSGAFGR
jgi:tight adherence protein C